MTAIRANDDCLTLSIQEAGALLGVSRSQAYRLARAGDLPTVKVGVRLRRVSRPALLRLLGAAGDPRRPAWDDDRAAGG